MRDARVWNVEGSISSIRWDLISDLSCHATEIVAYLIKFLKSWVLGSSLLKNSLSLLLHILEFVLGLLDDPLERTIISRRRTLVQQVNIDGLRERIFSLVDSLKPSGFAATVLTEQTVSSTVRHFDCGVLNEDFSVEDQRGGDDLDVSAGFLRCQYTGRDTVTDAVKTLLQLQLFDFCADLGAGFVGVFEGVAVLRVGLGSISGSGARASLCLLCGSGLGLLGLSCGLGCGYCRHFGVFVMLEVWVVVREKNNRTRRSLGAGDARAQSNNRCAVKSTCEYVRKVSEINQRRVGERSKMWV